MNKILQIKLKRGGSHLIKVIYFGAGHFSRLWNNIKNEQI